MNDNSPFNLVNEDSTPTTTPSHHNGSVKERIEELLHSSAFFLFMKGTPEWPQCGFSANVVTILNSLDLTFKSFDILSDNPLRQALKEYSQWPTYPQLYYKGQLVGGNDIVTEMYHSGELKKLFTPSSSPPPPSSSSQKGA